LIERWIREREREREREKEKQTPRQTIFEKDRKINL